MYLPLKFAQSFMEASISYSSDVWLPLAYIRTNKHPTTLKGTCRNTASDLHFKLTETAPGFVFSRLLTWRPVSGDFGPPLDAKEKLVSS